jgi:hypothetical protein
VDISVHRLTVLTILLSDRLALVASINPLRMSKTAVITNAAYETLVDVLYVVMTVIAACVSEVVVRRSIYILTIRWDTDN